jgi:hypothetical protein
MSYLYSSSLIYLLMPISSSTYLLHYLRIISSYHIPGVHFKLLYSGTKFFWRSKHTLDIHIYLHCITNVVEVIPFDVDRFKEMNRCIISAYPSHYLCINHPMISYHYIHIHHKIIEKYDYDCQPPPLL